MESYDIRTLPEAGATLDGPIEPTWVESALTDAAVSPELPIKAAGPGHMKLTIDRVSDHEAERPGIRVRGEISAKVSASCVRCLSDVAFELESSVELTFFPSQAPPTEERSGPRGSKRAAKAAEKKAEKDGVELDPGDLDEGTYEGFEIDIPGVVREALLLEMDMNPVCPDEAACTERTKALLVQANGESTEFEQVGPDPRWAGLKKFLLKNGDQ